MSSFEPSLKEDMEDSYRLRDEQLSLEDKLSMLQERSNEVLSRNPYRNLWMIIKC